MTVVETVETPTAPREIVTPMYDWMYSNEYKYWPNTPYTDFLSNVWQIQYGGSYSTNEVYNVFLVRPVITISKSALSS